jgi:hypothetical protein
MQLGTENRNKTIAAGVLLGLALILVARWIFSSPGTPTHASTRASAESGTRAEATARASAGNRKPLGAPRSLDPTLRYDWLKATEDTKYTGSGRNIFRAQVDIPKPVVSVAPHPVVPVNPGPPPPPPINLVFFGFANKPGEPKKVFLSQGDDVFIAKEGDIIDRRYKILRITPVSVEVEDVLNNNRQSIPLKQG